MELHKMIYKLRNASKMSQEEFANIFNVSRQSVQKWDLIPIVTEQLLVRLSVWHME